MALFLRKLERKLWLDPQYSKNLGGLAADAIKNFKTFGNSLSVFSVEDDPNLITRVLAAIIGGCDRICEAEYALFDSSILDDLGIKYEQEDGKTADAEVNKQHVNLGDLTADQINNLAEKIQAIGHLNRILHNKIEESLREGIQRGTIQYDRLNKKLATSLMI
ncbi:MAG: hypothetical protein Tsb0026_00150 [Sulfuricaulis sp.]